MGIKTTIRYTTIVNWLIAIGILNYAGPFASYNGSLLYIGMVGIVLILFLNSKYFYENKNLLIWKLCIAYFCLNSLFNLPRSLKYILIIVVGYLIIQRKVDSADCKSIYRICKIAAIVESAFIIIQRHLPDLFYPIAKKWFFYSDQYEFVRYAGTYSKQFSGLCYEVSFAALVCAIGITICFVDFLFTPIKKKRIYNLILILIAYYSIFLTGKRSIVLTIPVVLVFIYFVFARKQMNVKTIIFTLLLLFAAIFAMPTIYDWVLNVLSRGTGHGIQLTQRGEFWALAFEMFKENPITGLGLNSFDVRFNLSGIRPIYYDFAGAHNSYIQLLGETGIIGIILFLGAIMASIKKAISFSDYNKDNVMYVLISLGILFALMIYALTGNSFYQPQQLFCTFWCVSAIENLTSTSSRGEMYDN